ncbi:hypothetical protein [Sorangium sp. So ce1335]|uniref:hypothetical protein n=1 Tax=Sorangium sp. So ce1335 TaxID=3133335 RepID=UPI003F5EC407
MSNRERLMTANDVHVAMRFKTDQRRGKATCVLIDHSFFGSTPAPRVARVTHDRLVQDVFVSKVLRRECTYREEHIEELAAGWRAGRAAA